MARPSTRIKTALALLVSAGLVGLSIGRTLKRGADMPIGDPYLAEGLELQL